MSEEPEGDIETGNAPVAPIVNNFNSASLLTSTRANAVPLYVIVGLSVYVFVSAVFAAIFPPTNSTAWPTFQDFIRVLKTGGTGGDMISQVQESPEASGKRKRGSQPRDYFALPIAFTKLCSQEWYPRLAQSAKDLITEIFSYMSSDRPALRPSTPVAAAAAAMRVITPENADLATDLVMEETASDIDLSEPYWQAARKNFELRLEEFESSDDLGFAAEWISQRVRGTITELMAAKEFGETKIYLDLPVEMETTLMKTALEGFDCCGICKHKFPPHFSYPLHRAELGGGGNIEGAGALSWVSHACATWLAKARFVKFQFDDDDEYGGHCAPQMFQERLEARRAEYLAKPNDFGVNLGAHNPSQSSKGKALRVHPMRKLDLEFNDPKNPKPYVNMQTDKADKFYKPVDFDALAAAETYLWTRSSGPTSDPNLTNRQLPREWIPAVVQNSRKGVFRILRDAMRWFQGAALPPPAFLNEDFMKLCASKYPAHRTIQPGHPDHVVGMIYNPIHPWAHIGTGHHIFNRGSNIAGPFFALYPWPPLGQNPNNYGWYHNPAWCRNHMMAVHANDPEMQFLFIAREAGAEITGNDAAFMFWQQSHPPSLLKKMWHCDAQGRPLLINSYHLLACMQAQSFAGAVNRDYKQFYLRMCIKRMLDAHRGVLAPAFFHAMQFVMAMA